MTKKKESKNSKQNIGFLFKYGKIQYSSILKKLKTLPCIHSMLPLKGFVPHQ
jgi:hypothetical protein